MKKADIIAGIFVAVVVLAAFLLCAFDYPIRAYVDDDGNLVMKTALGAPERVPLDEAEAFECPDGFMSNLVRTNGLSTSRRQYGHYKDDRTGQKVFMFSTGPTEKNVFMYNGTVYIVDSWN